MGITIITGPPGAGKTTVAGQLVTMVPRGVHLVCDEVFHWIASGYIEPWRPESVRQNATVTAAIAAVARRFADGGYEVVVDGIVGAWFLPTWLEAQGGEAPNYVVLLPERAIASGRATARWGPGDLRDPEPVASMYEAFESVEGFSDHVVDSSRLGPSETVTTIVAGLQDGRFRLGVERRPAMERAARDLGT